MLFEALLCNCPDFSLVVMCKIVFLRYDHQIHQKGDLKNECKRMCYS